jgi:hypothetical protein
LLNRSGFDDDSDEEPFTSRTVTPNEETVEKDEYEQWLEEAERNNLLEFDELPAFNEPFAKLVKETIKCTDDFMETLRNEGHTFSYKNFVATLGGEPGYIFGIFGVKLVEKHRMWASSAHG